MSAQVIVEIALAVIMPGGLIGAIVALIKLRPDENTAVITQAQGAAVAQDTLVKGVERERDYWRDEAIRLRQENEHLRRELERLEREVGELTSQLEHVQADLSTLRHRVSPPK